jgi:hypothetical protein
MVYLSAGSESRLVSVEADGVAFTVSGSKCMVKVTSV